MSLDLPTPIDTALLNERVQAWADGLVASYKARYPARPGIDREGSYGITVDVLRKYWRITKTEYGDSRSVHAFLDPTTGDVYKAAGWKSPAKGVRFNLLDQASYEAMMARLDPFGAYLYK